MRYLRLTAPPKNPRPALPDCAGSYSTLADDVRYGRRVVTGACPLCSRRVAFVTCEGPRHERVLGLHPIATPVSK